MTSPNENEPRELITVQDELKKCCGNFCDKAAMIKALEQDSYCVICWTLADGIYNTEGPYMSGVAHRRGRQLAQLQFVGPGRTMEMRQDGANFIFSDNDGVDVLKITVSQLLPYGVVS